VICAGIGLGFVCSRLVVSRAGSSGRDLAGLLLRARPSWDRESVAIGTRRLFIFYPMIGTRRYDYFLIDIALAASNRRSRPSREWRGETNLAHLTFIVKPSTKPGMATS
jgi:hypothetical protein